MPNSSIWTLSGTTTPGQRGCGSNGNEGVLGIPQSFSITGASPSDVFVSYPGHLEVRVLYICRDAVGVFYSLIQADWALIWISNRPILL